MSATSDLIGAAIEEDYEDGCVTVEGSDDPMTRRLVAAKVRRKKAYLAQRVDREERIERWKQSGIARRRRRLRSKALTSNRPASRGQNLIETSSSDVHHLSGFAEHILESLERVGQIRDVDPAEGVFVGVLSGRSESDPEVVGRFPIAIVDPADLERLEVGMEFTLTTSQRALVSETGAHAKPSLQTTIVIHRPPPLSADREHAARARGRAARARMSGL